MEVMYERDDNAGSQCFVRPGRVIFVLEHGNCTFRNEDNGRREEQYLNGQTKLPLLGKSSSRMLLLN